ncbi:hypothetical protein D3C80_1150380 [compost metagenome]
MFYAIDAKSMTYNNRIIIRVDIHETQLYIRSCKLIVHLTYQCMQSWVKPLAGYLGSIQKLKALYRIES